MCDHPHRVDKGSGKGANSGWPCRSRHTYEDIVESLRRFRRVQCWPNAARGLSNSIVLVSSLFGDGRSGEMCGISKRVSVEKLMM